MSETDGKFSPVFANPERRGDTDLDQGSEFVDSYREADEDNSQEDDDGFHVQGGSLLSQGRLPKWSNKILQDDTRHRVQPGRHGAAKGEEFENRFRRKPASGPTSEQR